MKQLRLEALADGIFAIVITLLVFHIRLPELPANASDGALWSAIFDMRTFFASYVLSFAVLFTYWRAHHFIASVYAKGIDQMFVNINAVFFVLVALVPFSADMLGRYSKSPLSIMIFAFNIVCIGAVLYWMRTYAKRAQTIENQEVTPIEERHAIMRIMVPMFTALIAVILATYNTDIALIVLTAGILFNLSRRSTHVTTRILGVVFVDFKEK